MLFFKRSLVAKFGNAYANSSAPWSEVDIQDLRASLDFGNTIADAAIMLCRDEDEIRQKMKELGLVERRKIW